MRRLPFFTLIAFGALRCSGTETDNPASPLQSFVGGECDKSLPTGAPSPLPDGGVGVAALRLESTPEVAGLSCVAWKRDEAGVLRVSISNILDGCGIEWDGGRARVDGGDVYLEAISPRCMVAACGSCLYDFEYEVRDVPRDQDVLVHLSVTDGDGKKCNEGDQGTEVAEHRITLPAAEPEGTRCRLLQSYVYEPPVPCTLHMECGGSAQSACACPAGEACSPDAAFGESRCLVECGGSADCPVPAAFDCAGGVCRPKPGW